LRKINIYAIPIGLLFYANSVFGQENWFKKRGFSFSINSGMGFYKPLIVDKKLTVNGLLSFFHFQVNYKEKYFVRLITNQFNLNYVDNVATNGINISIDDRLETANTGIDLGYILFPKEKWSTYAYFGTGSANISSPQTMYNAVNNTLNITKQSGSFLAINAGIGLEFKVNELLVLSLESNYLTIPNYRNLTEKRLDGMTFQLGFKTPF
jgi:hypothetical protein